MMDGRDSKGLLAGLQMGMLLDLSKSKRNTN